MRKFSICFLLFTFYAASIYSQAENSRHAIYSISFINHSIGIPFKDFTKRPLNFGVTASVEFDYSKSGKGKHFQKLEIGWFNHKNLNTGIWIKTDYIRRYRHKSGLFADFQTGLGYIRDFGEKESFTLNENGQYQVNKNSSNGGLLVGFGMGTGYSVEVNEKYTIEPFIKYEAMLQTPYAKFVPFLPHLLLHVGTKFNMKK